MSEAISGYLGYWKLLMILDPLLRWWLRSGRVGWSRFHRRWFERGYLKTKLPTVSSVQDIEACLGQIKWLGDGPFYLYDCISYPQTTWVKKEDDCDGFASVAAELLRQLKLSSPPVLLTSGVWPLAQSHTVCVFNPRPGELAFFDNNTLRQEGDSSYAQIAAKIAARGNRFICWDVKDPSTLETLEFHRAT